jgi:hypothetical protein
VDSHMRHFGLNNAPATYRHVVSKTFKKYLNVLMKFLDDFTTYSEPIEPL